MLEPNEPRVVASTLAILGGGSYGLSYVYALNTAPRPVSLPADALWVVAHLVAEEPFVALLLVGITLFSSLFLKPYSGPA